MEQITWQQLYNRNSMSVKSSPIDNYGWVLQTCLAFGVSAKRAVSSPSFVQKHSQPADRYSDIAQPWLLRYKGRVRSMSMQALEAVLVNGRIASADSNSIISVEWSRASGNRYLTGFSSLYLELVQHGLRLWRRMFRSLRKHFYKIILPILIASVLYMSLLRGGVALCAASNLSRRSRFSLFDATHRTSIITALILTTKVKMSSTETMANPEVPQTSASNPLPKLSPSEFRQYNRLADMMQQYHNHFRSTWTTMYKACEANKRPSGMSIRQFLAMGEQFVSSLTVHHDIEERYIFPVLAEKMARFKDQEHLRKQHEGIHEGLDVFAQYVKDCRRGERELRLDEMKRIFDTFGEVLWAHLDDEVEELGAENMRKYWTVEEMRAIPF